MPHPNALEKGINAIPQSLKRHSHHETEILFHDTAVSILEKGEPVALLLGTRFLMF